MKDIKSCPFCGGRDIVYTEEGNDVWCRNCGAMVDHLSQWNDRPVEDQLRAEIARLKAALEKDAHRFKHCAEMIAKGWYQIGTTGLQYEIKASDYAREAREAAERGEGE